MLHVCMVRLVTSGVAILNELDNIFFYSFLVKIELIIRFLMNLWTPSLGQK